MNSSPPITNKALVNSPVIGNLLEGLLSNPNVGKWVSEDKQQQRREIAITAFAFVDELLKQESE